jgi:hypothetical protein
MSIIIFIMAITYYVGYNLGVRAKEETEDIINSLLEEVGDV